MPQKIVHYNNFFNVSGILKPKMENLIGFCFDLDGTLINTTEIGAAIEKEIYNEFDLEVDEETEKEIDELTYEIIQGENRNNLGRKVMWEIFKVLGLNFFQRIKALYISSKIFKEEIEKIHLFDGVEETFTFLEEHSIPYSIATTSSQKEVEDRLTKFPNFYKKVQGKIITRSDVKKLKPHQESLLKASKIMNVPPTRVVMVGDMHHDVLTGKNVNAITVAVLTGIFSKEKIYEYEPDFIIESVADIPKILDDIKQKINEN